MPGWQITLIAVGAALLAAALAVSGDRYPGGYSVAREHVVWDSRPGGS